MSRWSWVQDMLEATLQLCMETAVSLELLVTQAWVGGIVFNSLTLLEMNQGTQIESQSQCNKIDCAGVKTSLTLYSLLWKSRHFQRTHATLHPACMAHIVPYCLAGMS